jgi:hypothetical protein
MLRRLLNKSLQTINLYMITVFILGILNRTRYQSNAVNLFKTALLYSEVRGLDSEFGKWLSLLRVFGRNRTLM